MNFETSKNISESPLEETSIENTSEKRYEAWGKVLEVILHDIYEYEIPEAVVEDWKNLGLVMYRIDSLIDSKDEEQRKELTTVLLEHLNERNFSAGTNSEIEEELKIFEKIISDIPEENREFFERLVRMLLEVTEGIKKSKDVNEVKKLTLLEGQITTKLFISVLPSEFQEKEKYHEMTALLSRIGRIGNVLDTAVDLPRDYLKDQVMIKPTGLNRARFLGAALSEGLRMKKQGVMTFQTLKLFLRGMNALIRDREK